MPTPVAHGLMGAIVVAAMWRDDDAQPRWKPLLIGGALGVAPDLDVLLNILPGPESWHHDFTHSIAFAFLAGWLASIVTKQRAWTAALIFGFAMLTHPLLDYIFTSSDGVELWWPLSDERVRLGSQGFGIYAWRHPTLTLKVQALLEVALLELLFYGSMLTTLLYRKGWLTRMRSFISQE
jgi:membrane-bound metal-dependent hydrolase YbcI (DUF457 family)